MDGGNTDATPERQLYVQGIYSNGSPSVLDLSIQQTRTGLHLCLILMYFKPYLHKLTAIKLIRVLFIRGYLTI